MVQAGLFADQTGSFLWLSPNLGAASFEGPGLPRLGGPGPWFIVKIGNMLLSVWTV